MHRLKTEHLQMQTLLNTHKLQICRQISCCWLSVCTWLNAVWHADVWLISAASTAPPTTLLVGRDNHRDASKRTCMHGSMLRLRSRQYRESQELQLQALSDYKYSSLRGNYFTHHSHLSLWSLILNFTLWQTAAFIVWGIPAQSYRKLQS